MIDLVVRGNPPPIEGGGEVVPTRFVRKSGTGWRHQFGCENIQVAGRPQRAAEPPKLLGDPLDVLLRKEFLQRGNCRAEAPHGHPHLVNALRLGEEHGGLVAQQLRKAAAADLLQSGLDRHIGIETEGLCVNRRGSGIAALHQAVAPFRFAARLDPKRGHLQQLRGDVVESGGVTVLELEFHLADRLGPVLAGRPDLALVDRRLYRRSRQRFDREDCAGDFGHENWPQIGGRTLRQARPALRRIGVRSTLGDPIFPLAARQEIPRSKVSLLDGLQEMPALIADPQGEPALLERRVRRVVIGAGQPFLCADPRHRHERAFQLWQIGRPGSELEFDFRRNGSLPSYPRINRERRRIILGSSEMVRLIATGVAATRPPLAPVP